MTNMKTCRTCDSLKTNWWRKSHEKREQFCVNYLAREYHAKRAKLDDWIYGMCPHHSRLLADRAKAMNTRQWNATKNTPSEKTRQDFHRIFGGHPNA